MADIVLDPMCLLGISTYHQKNLPSGLGASIGILYALQKQLTYKISMSSALGTNSDSAKQIINRFVEYQSMKSRKAKNNVNYYDEFILVGWYFMGNSQKYFDTQKNKYQEIYEAFVERGGPYCLKIDNKGQASLFKDNKKVKFSAQMETLEKYCSDTMYFQSSKDQSALQKTLKKQQHIIQLYNDKLKKIQKLLGDDCTQEKKRQILQLLNTYERMQYFNSSKKNEISQTMNYSILHGLIINHRKIKQ